MNRSFEICQALKFHADSLDHLEGSGVGVARCALSATACYFYFEEEPGRPVGAKRQSFSPGTEARRVAANFAKLPGLLRKSRCADAPC